MDNEQATANLEGAEFTLAELCALRDMFRGAGAKGLMRLLGGVQAQDVANTLGSMNVSKVETFWHAQGAYCLADRIGGEWPQAVQAAITDLEGATPEPTQNP